MIHLNKNIFVLKERVLFYYIALIAVLPLTEIQAQDVEQSKDLQIQSAFLNTVRIYDKELSRNTMVYTGRSYFDDNNNIQGHQFFVDDYWEHGSVVYDEISYDSIYLKYDIFSDQLLIENFNIDGFPSPIILFKDKIESFELMGHHFVRLDRDSISNLKEGFYDIMFQGNENQVLVKRRKEIVNSNEVNTIKEMFTEKDRYYIKKGDICYQVKKRKSVLRVLADRKKEVKSYIKKSGIQFINQPDINLVDVVKFYESFP